MNHRDAEMSDVVVVLHDDQTHLLDDAVAQLKAAGVEVTDTDADSGTVEGTVEASKVKSLESIASVKYVRRVFDYVADFPVGDPRDQDLSEDEADRADPV